MAMNESGDVKTRMNVDEARGAVEAVLASSTFARSKRGRELLAYLVEKTLEGRQSELKAFSIACDVFGRDQNFDADNDALVRVQAARLRSLLEDYYAHEGREHRLRISLPKGAYVPLFEIVGETTVIEEPGLTAGEPPAAEAPVTPPVSAGGRAGGGWLTGAITALALAAVAIIALGWQRAEKAGEPKPPSIQAVSDGSISVLAASFSKFSPDVSDKSLEFIRSQLMQLTQMSFVTIFSDKAARADGAEVDPMEIARRRGINYLLEGRVLGADGALRVSIDLLDVKSGKYVWTQSYDQKTPAGVKTLDEFALSLMSSLHIVLLRAASRNARDISLDSATPWDLYFLASWINGNSRNNLAWEKERVALARLAIQKDPEFGPAYSLLASKLAFLGNADPASDTPEARAEAKHFAHQAVEKAPSDADVTFNLALYYWHAGRISDAVANMRRTLDLAPHHPLARFMANVLPYTCAPAPAGVIDQLIAYDASLPPNSGERWVTLAWVSLLYLNNGDFAHAVEYGRRSFAIFHSPDSMFRYAAALAHLGEGGEAQEILDEQKEYWPTLDPRHYANVVIPRRCQGAPLAEYLRGVYRDLIPAAGQRQ